MAEDITTRFANTGIYAKCACRAHRVARHLVKARARRLGAIEEAERKAALLKRFEPDDEQCKEVNTPGRCRPTDNMSQPSAPGLALSQVITAMFEEPYERAELQGRSRGSYLWRSES